MSIIDGARALRAVILQAVLSLDDKAASAAPALFPRLLEDGSLVRAGTRICWNGRIKRAASDLWDRPENNPDNAPNLWEDIAYREGFRIIPDTITTTTAFFFGEKGWWDGVLYESKLEANVWTPKAYPDGWAVASE